MSKGTQLDFFEPVSAKAEFKMALRDLAKQLASIKETCSSQQNTLCKLYLALRREADEHKLRVAQLEKGHQGHQGP